MRTSSYLIALAAFGLLAFASSASAQVEEQKEEAEVQSFEIDQVERERVLEEAQSGPETDMSWMQDDVDIQELERRETAIRRLRDLVEGTPTGDAGRPEYMFRLAELYFEQGRTYEARAYERRDEAFAIRAQNERRADAYEQAAADDLAQSERLSSDAAALYAELYQTYSDTYENMDAVLYYLGSSFLRMEQREAAKQIYEELGTRYPRSDYLPQGMLMLGELAFEAGDLEEALRYYEIVIQRPNSVAYPYGLYKKAWCLYNMAASRGEFEEALQLLYDAVQASQQTASGQRMALTRQALRDMALFYAEVYDGDRAMAFFEEIAPDDYVDLVERLARIYGDKALYDDSNTLYQQLIALNRDSFKVVQYQAEIVRNTQPDESASEVDIVREIRALVRLFNTSRSFDDATPALVAEVSTSIETLLRQVATTYHREGQVTQNEQYYALAFSLYEDYAANFPDGEHAYTMWFYYAEMLYRNEDWLAAANAYDAALARSPQEGGQYDDEANYGSCLARTKLVDLSGTTTATTGQAMAAEDDLPPIPQPREIPEEYQVMMSSCDRFLASEPEPAIAAEIEYAVAYVYYDYDHLDEAVDRFGGLALSRGVIDEQRSLVAAELVLDSLVLQRKYGEMREWIERIQGSSLNNTELGPRLLLLHEQISFRECRDMQTADDHEGASQCFFEFVNNNLDSELVDRGIYNAAISFREINNLDYSIAMFEQLPVLAPNSDLVPDTVYELGRTFHRLAVYDVAADYYERYIGYEDEGENAVNALANAAQFRQGLGQHELALRDLRAYIDVVEDSDDHGDEAEAEAQYQIGRTQRARGEDDAAIRAFEKVVDDFRRDAPSRAIEAQGQIADIYAEREREDRARRAYNDTLELIRGLDPETRAELSFGALDAASKAQFMLAEEVFARFEATDIEGRTDEAIQEAVREKQELGAEATRLYDAVVFEFARPGWMIASLTRLGQLYHVFYKQVIDAPVPRGLDPLVEEEYRTEIERIAEDQRQEAMARYMRAIEIARETGWFNSYSELAAQLLQEIDPAFRAGSEARIPAGYDSIGFYRSGYLAPSGANELSIGAPSGGNE